MPYTKRGRHISDKEMFDKSRTPRVVTGGTADFQGNVFQIHLRARGSTARRALRVNRFGRFMEKPWRSRRMRGISMDPRRYNAKGQRILPVLSWLGRQGNA